MAGRSVIFEDENEGYVSVHVQFKIVGVDLDNLKSDGKVFRVGGREYPTSRYGTWALQGFRNPEEVASNLMDGGIAVAITWAIWQNYKEISTWLKNVHEQRFTFDMRKNKQKHILSEIGSGKMAKSVEKSLRELENPDVYKSIKIKLIKIITETPTSKTTAEEGPASNNFWNKPSMQRLVDAEKVANLMQDENFSWAFLALKQSLAREKDEAAMLQMLIRICICAVHLKNTQEMDESFLRIVHLVQKADIPPEEVNFYLTDVWKLFLTLVATRSFIKAIELLFAFIEVVKKIPDADKRMDKLSVHVNGIISAAKDLLSKDPGACLKSQILGYVKKVESEIEFLRRQTGCNSLNQSRCLYYAVYELTEVKSALQIKMDAVFNESSFEFKRLSSCWADLPFVVTRLRMHPEVSKYFEDEEFQEDITAISEKPSRLRQKIQNPKIARANEVLTSEFGIFAQTKDARESFESFGLSSGAFGATSVGKKTESKPVDKPVDKKEEAQKEKEKGNEAYKRKQFVKALSHYDKALALDPTDALLHNNKAAVYISDGKLDVARLACLAAIDLAQSSTRHDDKDVAKITARLARVEFLDKRIDIALALYQRSLRLNPDPKVQEQMKKCEGMLHALRVMSSMGFPF